MKRGRVWPIKKDEGLFRLINIFKILGCNFGPKSASARCLLVRNYLANNLRLSVVKSFKNLVKMVDRLDHLYFWVSKLNERYTYLAKNTIRLLTKAKVFVKVLN